MPITGRMGLHLPTTARRRRRSQRLQRAGPHATGERGESAWRRAHAGSGITSGLILAYVERQHGRAAVQEMLERAGLGEREDELRDEGTWFSFEEKIRLWEAAEALTGDPEIAVRGGESALALRVGVSLKRALRALGSPDLVYRNVVRANSKFNWAHTLEVIARAKGRVELSYRDVAGVGYHRYDCDYTIGLLRAVPQLFGMPPARVEHVQCAVSGAERCVFEVSWSDGLRRLQRSALAGLLSAACLGAVGLASESPAAPAVPLAACACLGISVAAAGRWARIMRRRVTALETAVRDQDMAMDAQLRSLAALSSDLRLERALERVTASAGTAIAGARFALLIADAGGMCADGSSSLPERALSCLERWAQENRARLRDGPIVLDRLESVPSRGPLAEDPELPLGSACAAPLLFHEDLLGALIALAPGTTVFLPHDARALEIYAGHAAIALWNARLVDRLEREAAEDPLTGLANRRRFSLASAAEVDRAARHGSTVAMVMLDIDHFKRVNDTYGHPLGDQILVRVARALRAAVRSHDTVARLGGEEFALLLPESDAERAMFVAERARDLISRISLPDGQLSCSAGVAAIAGVAGGEGQLFAAADRALYEAKRRGRARSVLADGPPPAPRPARAGVEVIGRGSA
jgi:diguanylate cyclase (GGDEF)-like protein